MENLKHLLQPNHSVFIEFDFRRFLTTSRGYCQRSTTKQKNVKTPGVKVVISPINYYNNNYTNIRSLELEKEVVIK